MDCTDIKNIGHLGIICAIFKEYKLIQKIDALLPKTSLNQKISHGEAVLAMIMQGLGYTNHRLYLSKEFFSNLALADLFKPGLEYENFNSSVLSRTLDEIYKYGATNFFSNVCLTTITENNLLEKFLHIDTTSFSVTGKKYKGQGKFNLCHGYSKDYRNDLKQLVYLMVATEDGLPVFSEVHSGNAADSELFEKTLLEVQSKLKDNIENKIFVLDSSLYNKKFLLNKNISGYWISRVPESVKECKNILETDYDDSFWTKEDIDYKYLQIDGIRYGGKLQKWILVRNREAKYKEINTFQKKLDRQEKNIQRAIKKLEKRLFKENIECLEAIRKMRSNYKYFTFTQTVASQHKKVRGTKKKVVIGFKAFLKYKRNESKIKKMKLRKGKFILATNCFNKEVLPSEDILKAYRSRNRSIEGNFKFIKDKSVNLGQIYLKKESRIEAMLMIMGLIIFVNKLAQKKLRSHLQDSKNNTTVPNQLGKPIKNPTFSWASYLLRNINKIRVLSNDIVIDKIHGIGKAQKTIIQAFGSHAEEIYGYP